MPTSGAHVEPSVFSAAWRFLTSIQSLSGIVGCTAAADVGARIVRNCHPTIVKNAHQLNESEVVYAESEPSYITAPDRASAAFHSISRRREYDQMAREAR